MKLRRQSESKLVAVSKSSSIMLPPLMLSRRASELKPNTETKNRTKKQLITKYPAFDSKPPKQAQKPSIPQPPLSTSQPQSLTTQAHGIYTQTLTPLTQHNPQLPLQIASLTKITTLLTSLRLCDRYNIQIKNTYFRISSNAASTIGTVAQLDPKDWITVEDLFYGLMLPSGNDAAVGLAENLGAYVYYEGKGEGKTLGEIRSLDITNDTSFLKLYQQNFIKQMNQLSKQLQLQNTHFTNPHGLDCKEAYSTVRDLAVLTKKAMEHPIASKILCCRNYFARLKISIGKKETAYREIDWTNTNRLMWRKGFLGGKTGQTMGAGSCLATVYQHEGEIYYVIVLGCLSREHRFTDTQKLVNKEILKLE